MNKNDVYKLIGYHGEYNTSVKKALRKLLKENHPDNKGDRKKFELINEVKKELESGKSASIPEEIIKDDKDIDYVYCYKMINELKVKKNSLNELLNAKRSLLNDYESEYKVMYDKSLNLENSLLINSPYIKEVQKLKSISIVLLILMIIVFGTSIIQNSNLLFLLFLVLSVIFVYFVQKHLLFVHKLTENNKKRFTSYISINNSIKKNIKKQKGLKKEINDIKRKIINVENDLRFYKNLLK